MASYGFKGWFTLLRIDTDKFTKEMDRRALQVNREAAREWVRAAYIRVPVWTGMARGMFKYAKGRSGPSAGIFLSVYLKVLVPIGPTRTHDGGPLEIRRDKSPEIGGRQSRYTFSSTAHRYTFTINTNIPHFELNDQTSGKPPSYTRPWGAFEAGDGAYRAYISQNAKKVIPNVWDYRIRTRLNING